MTTLPEPAKRTEPDPECKLRDKGDKAKKPAPKGGWQVRHDKETDKL